MTHDPEYVEPTEEEVSAILAVLHRRSITIPAELPPRQPAWLTASRTDGVERWPQPHRVSRLFRKTFTE